MGNCYLKQDYSTYPNVGAYDSIITDVRDKMDKGLYKFIEKFEYSFINLGTWNFL